MANKLARRGTKLIRIGTKLARCAQDYCIELACLNGRDIQVVIEGETDCDCGGDVNDTFLHSNVTLHDPGEDLCDCSLEEIIENAVTGCSGENWNYHTGICYDSSIDTLTIYSQFYSGIGFPRLGFSKDFVGVDATQAINDLCNGVPIQLPWLADFSGFGCTDTGATATITVL